ncbi:diguanylate cyclase domain-containing protein [Hydrogenimonas sp.]
MSLTKQIGIVVSLLLLLLLGGVLGLYFFKTKSFYEARLTADAQEITHTLSLSLRSDLKDANKSTAIIDAAFASRLYTEISLEDLKSGRLIYVKRKPEELSEVPGWFVQNLHIQAPHAEEVIEGANDRFAKLAVVTDRSAIYRQMYDLFVYTVGLFVVFGIVGLILLNLVLKVILRSLENIKNQAEGVIHNRFIIQKEIPATTELKNVVLAMNSMVKRVKELYNRSAEMMRQSQEMLYLDHATGLFNRRYFQLKLPEYLLANDTRSRGTLMIVRMKGIIEGNKKIGRKKMDELLHSFARILKEVTEKVHEPLICRVNGTEFALLLPTFNRMRADDLGQTLISKHLLLSEQYGLRETLKLSIGACEYERKVQPGKLLSCVDSALSDAAMYNESHIVSYELDDANRPTAGKGEWRDIITKALKEGRFKPHFLPVHDLKQNREITHVLSFDIVHNDHIIKYGDYVPAVVELGLEYELMNYEFDYMKHHRFTQNSIAFEMIADMLQESDKLFIFEDTIKEITENLQGPLFVEISEHDILALEPIVVERVSIALKKYGARFGINRFSGERGEYGYLKYSAPAYVKMNESSFLDLDTASKNALLTLLGSLDIELIVVGVHAENIPELTSNAIRFIMYND